MSRDLNTQKSIFEKEFATLTSKRDEILDNLQKRGYSVRQSVSSVDTLYHIKDRAGCYQGSACEKAVKKGLFAGSFESQTHYNRQVLVSALSRKSQELSSSGADFINEQSRKLEAFGCRIAVTEYPNTLRIKVSHSQNNEVRELNLDTKGLSRMSDRNKEVATWLTDLTSELKKQRRA